MKTIIQRSSGRYDIDKLYTIKAPFTPSDVFARTMTFHSVWLWQRVVSASSPFYDLKGKGSFYIAQYPVRWTAQSASHFLPSLTDLFIPTPFSASPGSILARQQLRAMTKSLTFPPVYSQVLIYTAESTGTSMERTKMPNLRNGTKGGFEPGLTRLRVRHSTTEPPRSTYHCFARSMAKMSTKTANSTEAN